MALQEQKEKEAEEANNPMKVKYQCHDPLLHDFYTLAAL
jgi:hypothetical protein